MSNPCDMIRDAIIMLFDIKADDAREQPRYSLSLETWMFLDYELYSTLQWFHRYACEVKGEYVPVLVEEGRNIKIVMKPRGEVIAAFCGSIVSKIRKTIEVVEKDDFMDMNTRNTIMNILKKVSIALVDICKDSLHEGTLREIKRLAKQLSEIK